MTPPLGLVRWRRLDLPGTDEAELAPASDGYRLAGSVRYHDHDGPVALRYIVGLTPDWVTCFARVTGATPAGPLRIEVTASEDRTWALDHRAAPEVSSCIDLDLGFTPATNLLSIRRLALAVGARAEVTVAWFPSLAEGLAPLRQIYHRIAEDRYLYRCPDLPFESTLRVDAEGFVRDYPPLWEELR